MLTLDQVSKTYQVGAFGGQQLHAVRDVSFTVERGSVTSLIGESGSGKSTIGKMILKLLTVTDGRITLDGRDVSTFRRSQVTDYYRSVQGVFQDPFSSYNPVYKADHIFDMIRENFFPRADNDGWRARVEEKITDVCLEPGEVLGKYPHQLSGGQLQRMLIARALLLDIDILVADEIISMLDASTRIDVLNLLSELKERGLGILFITHDLALGNYVSDRVIILRRGVIVEMGTTAAVFDNPLHPYSRSLLASVPQLDRKWSEVEQELAAREAELRLGERCLFHEQYPDAAPGEPGLAQVADDHLVGCFELDAQCRPTVSGRMPGPR